MGPTQLTQYFNMADASNSPHHLSSQSAAQSEAGSIHSSSHEAAAQPVADSIYSDSGAFSIPGSSSHGAPNTNPSDYGSAFGSDLNDYLDTHQMNIQQQQAQIPSIAHAALDIQPMIPANLSSQSSSSSSVSSIKAVDDPNLMPSAGVGYHTKQFVKLWNGNPIVGTETSTSIAEQVKPEPEQVKPEQETRLPNKVTYSTRGTPTKDKLWIEKLRPAEQKKLAAYEVHYKGWSATDLNDLYAAIQKSGINFSGTNAKTLKNNILYLSLVDKIPLLVKTPNGNFVPRE